MHNLNAYAQPKHLYAYAQPKHLYAYAQPKHLCTNLNTYTHIHKLKDFFKVIIVNDKTFSYTYKCDDFLMYYCA